MGRRSKGYERPEPWRDARLIVIAVEGSDTEKNYFDIIKEDGKRRDISINVIPNNDNKSAPEFICENIRNYIKSYDVNLSEGDSLYVVIDYDRWGDKKISYACTETMQMGAHFIVSNPCFELWLLLHREDVSLLPEDEKEKIFHNKRVSNKKKYIESLISKHIGGYDKSNKEHLKRLMTDMRQAISNAKKLESDSSARWPAYLGTRVYIVLEDILNK